MLVGEWGVGSGTADAISGGGEWGQGGQGGEGGQGGQGGNFFISPYSSTPLPHFNDRYYRDIIRAIAIFQLVVLL